MIATANFGELLDAAALLAAQPAPSGRRVGVVSNTRGGGMLAADACADAGLEVASLADETQRALADLLPRDAVVSGPVDTTAAVVSGLFRWCLELVGADPGVDAVLAVTATTATSDLIPEVRAAHVPVPIVATVMDQVEGVRLLPGPDEDSPAVPAYAYPESAAWALGHAARYGAWRATPPGSVPVLEDLHQDQARELVARFLAGTPEGGWLPSEQTVELLSCYGMPLADGTAATAGGVRVKITVLEEPVFGPLVLFGLAGAAAGVLADRAARLTPLTDADADDLIRSVRAAPMLPGRSGGPATDRASLRSMLLRVSQLADDVPQVAELELSPVIARPDGVLAVDARVRIQAAEPADAYLRQLL